MTPNIKNEIEERAKIRKQRRNRRRLLSFLGFILLLIYIPAIWNWIFSTNHEIGVIKTDTLELKYPIQGVLLRNEQVLKSPGDGYIIPNILYGDRVAKGGDIAAYIQTDAREVVENYRQLEVEILKRVVVKFDSSSGTEREVWENAIEKQMTKLVDIANTGNLSNAVSVRGAVNHILEAKARYMLESDTVQSSMKSEKNELDRLRSNIDKSVTDIYSNQAGVLSYHYDGFEDTYNPGNRNDITAEEIKNLVDENETADNLLTPAEISVKRDQVFGKVIANDEAWIVFLLPEKEGKEIAVLFEKSKLENSTLTYDLELDGVSERIPILLESIQEPIEGYQKVTARMNKFIEKTTNLRGVAGSLVLQSITGMKVPLRSLFNVNQVDDTADIVIEEMGKAVFRRVQIVGRQDTYAIIENIDPTDTEEQVNIFDVYLVDPKNVVEGQVIEN